MRMISSTRGSPPGRGGAFLPGGAPSHRRGGGQGRKKRCRRSGGPTRCDRISMPRRTDIHKILLIGSGPIVIGQACEFDYSGTQACKGPRGEGYKGVLRSGG